MKLEIPKATTSKRITIKILDASTGLGVTGLVYNSSGLVWAYRREDAGNAGGTSVTLATATLGTWASGGFKETDATKHPGHYEIGLPDAALVAGASWVVMTLQGVTNMAPVELEIQLVDTVSRNRAFSFSFPMFDSSNALKTGETITATRSIDNAAFASCANSVSEIGTTGVYKIDLTAADLNGAYVTLRFTSAGTIPLVRGIVLQG